MKIIAFCKKIKKTNKTAAHGKLKRSSGSGLFGSFNVNIISRYGRNGSSSKPDRTSTFTGNPGFTRIVKVLVIGAMVPNKSNF